MAEILLASSAFAIACLSALLGIGGGIFLIPLLVLVFGHPMPQVVGAVLAAMVPFSLVATISNSRNGLICYKFGLLFEIPTVLGAALGAFGSAWLPREILQIFFALLAAWSGYLMLRPPQEWLKRVGTGLREYNRHHSWFYLHLEEQKVPVNGLLLGVVGLFAGLTSGLLGVGGGWMKTPIMIYLFELPPRQAVGTAIFMICFTSATGALSHLALGNVHQSLLLPLLVGYPLGALVGSLYLPKMKSESHKKLIGWAMFLIGIFMGLSPWIGEK